MEVKNRNQDSVRTYLRPMSEVVLQKRTFLSVVIQFFGCDFTKVKRVYVMFGMC